MARAIRRLAARLSDEQALHRRTAPALQVPVSLLLLTSFVLPFAPRLVGLNLPVTSHIAPLEWIGLVVDLAGIAFAIWARLVLGNNWSGLMVTAKHGHELVQNGPFAIVRHPIYAGLLLAIFGTALTLQTLASYISMALGFIAIIIRVSLEERLLRERFGDAHAAYQRRTQTLIPFVW
jgi:protein-S-isoprenylcysteine O-methyltransferase Ste14